ncbi:L-aminopeptidase/D-esterase, partial [Aureobasidium melanogenum]
MVRRQEVRVPDPEPRMRIRELLPDLFLGDHQPGPLNSLTDVPGIGVSTQEITSTVRSINTGVTCITPREDWSHKACYAGLFSFNGYGEMTGAHDITENGLLYSPIILTGTFGIGSAHQGVLKRCQDLGQIVHGIAFTPKHVIEGLQSVKTGVAVEEGNSGGGNGMICHGFKGGNGSSSRQVKIPYRDETFTVACMVQANYGAMKDLRIAGVPIGRILVDEAQQDEKRKKAKEELEKAKEEKDGSIIIIIATDAPLLPHHLTRIAKRATVGVSRVGGIGHNMSGDIFLAFSTANEILVNQPRPVAGESKSTIKKVKVVEDSALSSLFEGTADCVEEAIYNSLFMAETMVGLEGHKVEALPLKRVKEIMNECGRAQLN